jgi:hypothetical protein
MKQSLVSLLCCVLMICFHPSATADTQIHFLGNASEDIRLDYLENYFHDADGDGYEITYYSEIITTDDFSSLKKGKYDVVILYQKALQEAARQDLLMPLNDLATETQWIKLSTLLEQDGNIYGLPFYYLADLLSLNLGVARRVNFQFPQASAYTWTDLLQACDQSSLSKEEDVCLMYTNLNLPFFLMQMLSAQYSEQGDVHFDTSFFRETMPIYAEMVRKEYFLDSKESHQAASILTLTSSPEYYVPFPSMDDNNDGIVVDLYALCIPKSTSNPEAAMAFLAAYASSTCQEKISLGDWSHMVCQSSDIYGVESEQCFPYYTEQLHQQIITCGVARFPNAKLICKINDSGIILDYINQELTIDEIISELQCMWEDIKMHE